MALSVREMVFWSTLISLFLVYRLIGEVSSGSIYMD